MYNMIRIQFRHRHGEKMRLLRSMRVEHDDRRVPRYTTVRYAKATPITDNPLTRVGIN